MHDFMSEQTKAEVLATLRPRYGSAGREHKSKLIAQAVQLLGYHPKSAIRALRRKPRAPATAALILGRPRAYEPGVLLPVLKPIWFAAFQPCRSRFVALLPDWLPAYEQDHRRLDAGVREALLNVSARTLDRLLAPLRGSLKRRGGTRPGSLLRQSIPIRGEWTEEGPGWLELDTVALCGGTLDDRHAWMLDAVDIRTDWTVQRALENRSQHSTLTQLRDVEASLPFPLLGVDSDNGGEFINHHVVAWTGQRPRPVLFTRSRPYRKNDNAHVEQRNWTHVRQQFGYERYDNPAVVPLINTLCQGALGQLLNYFLPTHKLEQKHRQEGRTTRIYGAAQTPLARVLSAPQVSEETKAKLKTEHARLNPFQLARDIERQKKVIEARRRRET
ncbi:MAG: transposase family protein [Verrucomicrobia bacterium]|nr:transposase family protein [Verrucomicrobiota bacterium]